MPRRNKDEENRRYGFSQGATGFGEIWPESQEQFRESIVPPDEPPPPPPRAPRPPEVAGDRRPAAAQSVTGKTPIPVPRTNNGAGMNMAEWVSTYERWGRDMLRMGFLPDQLPAIAEAAGEKFPKSLVATFHAQDALGPRADMLQQYDYDSYQQRSQPHRNADYPEGTGFGEWEPIPDVNRQAHDDFWSWKENPNNYAWIDKFGGHAYAAWMASPSGRGTPGALQGQTTGFGTSPTTSTPVTPGSATPGKQYADSPTVTAHNADTIGYNPNPPGQLGLGGGREYADVQKKYGKVQAGSTQQLTNQLSGYGIPLLSGSGTSGFGGTGTSGATGRVSIPSKPQQPPTRGGSRLPQKRTSYLSDSERPTSAATNPIKYRY